MGRFFLNERKIDRIIKEVLSETSIANIPMEGNDPASWYALYELYYTKARSYPKGSPEANKLIKKAERAYKKAKSFNKGRLNRNDHTIGNWRSDNILKRVGVLNQYMPDYNEITDKSWFEN